MRYVFDLCFELFLIPSGTVNCGFPTPLTIIHPLFLPREMRSLPNGTFRNSFHTFPCLTCKLLVKTKIDTKHMWVKVLNVDEPVSFRVTPIPVHVCLRSSDPCLTPSKALTPSSFIVDEETREEPDGRGK